MSGAWSAAVGRLTRYGLIFLGVGLAAACGGTRSMAVYVPPTPAQSFQGIICVKTPPQTEAFKVFLDVYKAAAHVKGGYFSLESEELFEHANRAVMEELQNLGLRTVPVSTDEEALKKGCDYYLEGSPYMLTGDAFSGGGGDYSVVRVYFADVLAVHISDGQRIMFDGHLTDTIPPTKLGYSLVECSFWLDTCHVPDVLSPEFKKGVSMVTRRGVRIIMGVEQLPQKK